MVQSMSDAKFTDVYDDGNIPDVDMPQNSMKNKSKDSNSVKTDEKALSGTQHSGKNEFELSQ